MTDVNPRPPADPRFEPLSGLPDPNLVPHPLADENPMTDPSEYEGLKTSVAKIGIQHPIVPYRDAGVLKILDGRNRYAAAREVGHRLRPTDFTQFVGSIEEATDLAHALNNHRRHLSREQKEAMVADLLRKYPNLPSRQLAVMAGVSHTTIAKLRKPKVDDGKLRALVRAWENASVADQERFVQSVKVDLREMLGAL